MSTDLIARLRATSYLHHRGPDYEPLPVPPSALALEAADALDAAKDQLRYFGELHEKEFRASEARATALEKALADFAQRIDNDGTASQIVSADEIRALLSAKGGDTP